MSNQISISDAITFAAYYGIEPSHVQYVHELPSYDDQVFHIDIKPEFHTKSVIMKCAKINDFHRVDMTIKLALHLLKHSLPTPRPIPLVKQYAADHPYIFVVKSNGNNIKIHCTEYIDGVLADKIKHSPKFLDHLGKTIANVHSVLIEDVFTHRAEQWEDDWAPSMTDIVIERIPDLNEILDHDPRRLFLVKYYLNLFRSAMKPTLNQMPQCMILGDINDSNIICDPNGQIKALIDFGESHKTNRVFDIGICCAYFMLNRNIEDGLSILMQIVMSYHRVLPLTLDEIDTVFIAAASRWLISAVFGIKNAKENPQNPWLLHHATPAWNALDQYARISPQSVSRKLRQKIMKQKL